MNYKVINASVMESQNFCGIFSSYEEAEKFKKLLESYHPQYCFKIVEV